uniref:Uncharacterized protein n=1 Tax=Chrysotila carterae TaxID=13221 RepID=A0A7S4BQC4_CHRCT
MLSASLRMRTHAYAPITHLLAATSIAHALTSRIAPSALPLILPSRAVAASVQSFNLPLDAFVVPAPLATRASALHAAAGTVCHLTAAITPTAIKLFASSNTTAPLLRFDDDSSTPTSCKLHLFVFGLATTACLLAACAVVFVVSVVQTATAHRSQPPALSPPRRSTYQVNGLSNAHFTGNSNSMMALPPARPPWRSSLPASAGLSRRSRCRACASPPSASTRQHIYSANQYQRHIAQRCSRTLVSLDILLAPPMYFTMHSHISLHRGLCPS